MSRHETIHEINHILDHFSDEALESLLVFLKNLEEAQPLFEKDKPEE